MICAIGHFEEFSPLRKVPELGKITRIHDAVTGFGEPIGIEDLL
jgi:hypothetical protein